MKGAISTFRDLRTVCDANPSCNRCPIRQTCPAKGTPAETTDEDILQLLQDLEIAVKAVKNEIKRNNQPEC